MVPEYIWIRNMKVCKGSVDVAQGFSEHGSAALTVGF